MTPSDLNGVVSENGNASPVATNLAAGSDDELLIKVLAEYSRALEAGQPFDRNTLISLYPKLADQLRECLDGLNLVQQVSPGHRDGSAVDAAPPPQTLGDFRILREIGRGGMGVVYLAEQTSLHRQVALKILPLAAVLDPRHLQRFKNEVQAAALLQHSHIVPVYAIGCERGLHYYAMQYVEGDTLAGVIAELRTVAGLDVEPMDTSDRTGYVLNAITGRLTKYLARAAASQAQNLQPGQSNPLPEPASATLAVAALSTNRTPRNTNHYHGAANMIIQAAEALDHAHRRGVLHRDVKPSNLLIDVMGNVWIADFGLARLEADVGLTMTGDVLGTLRYMSPEQALAKRVVVDHRTDIYSLGATLYELLTLQPVYATNDRQELLKQIAFTEPPKPRSINAAIPQELQTIALKALEKNPVDRYGTAQEMADDLRRYLDDRPLLAQPPSLGKRLVKWSHRNVPILWTITVMSLVAGILLAISTLAANLAKRKEADAKNAAQAAAENAVRERSAARMNQYNAEIVSGQTDLEQGNLGRLDEKLIRHLPLGDEPDRRGWEWYYLLSMCHPEQRTLHGPGFKLFAAWSPDGKYIASSSTIWNAKSGECIRRMWFDGRSVAWSPDGQKVAWGNLGSDSCIYIWNRQTDKVTELRGHKSSVWCIKFSPDGKRLASGSIDQSIKIWDLDTGKVVRTLNVEGMVSDVDWSSDGKLIAVGVCYQSLQVWRVSNGERVMLRKEPDPSRVTVSWRPDGRQLAVNTPTHWYILDRPDWKLVVEHGHRIASNEGSGIAWSPAGTQVAVANGTVVTLWDPVHDQQVTRLAGHIMPVNSVDWSPDGRRLVTTAYDEIRIWDVQSPLQPPAIVTPAPLQRLSWESNSETLVSVAASDMKSSFWRVTDGARIKDVPVTDIDRDAKDAGVLSPDRRLTARWNRSDKQVAITVRDAQTGAVHSIWHAEESFNPVSYAWSPDGSKLAIITSSPKDVQLEAWDANQEQRIARWTERNPNTNGQTAEVAPPTWSPNGARVAVIGTHQVYVFDVGSGKRILQRALGNGRESSGGITALAFNSANLLALGNSLGFLAVVDVDTGSTAMSCKAHDVSIRAIDWSPDGQRLATVARDGLVKVIESSNGNELLSLHISDGSASFVAWSPDGMRLAAANDDGMIQVWDARRGYEFADRGSRHSKLAWAYFRLGDEKTGEAANAALRKFLDLSPKTLEYRERRGIVLARLGQYDEAAQEFAAAVPSQTQMAHSSYRRAIALLGARNLDAYHELCETLIGSVQNGRFSHRLDFAWLGALVPNAVDGFADFVKSLAEDVAEKKLHPDFSAYNELGDDTELILGAMFYRVGRYEDAVGTLTDLSGKLEGKPDQEGQHNLTCAKYFLAMTRHQLGHEFQARRCLDEALATDQTLQMDPSLPWEERVMLNTLQREAKGQIKP